MLKRLCVLLLILSVMSFGMAACHKDHQTRVNIISNAADILLTSYQAAEDALVAAKNVGQPEVVANWDKISEIRNKVSPVMRKIALKWKEVPRTDAAIENFVLSPDFLDGLDLAIQLGQSADLNELDDVLRELQGISDAIKEARQ